MKDLVELQLWLWRQEPAQGIKPCRPDTHMSTEVKLWKHVAFLVVPWLRICLPRQDTGVPSLVGELRCHEPWGDETLPQEKEHPPKTGEVRPRECINVNSLAVMLIKG